MKNKQQLVRNRTKAIIGISLAAILTTGCTQMLTHVRFDDEQSNTHGVRVMAVEICGSLSFLDKEKGEVLRSAMLERLRYAVYNEAEFERGKLEAITRLSPLSRDELRKACGVIDDSIDERISYFNRQNQGIASARSRDLIGINTGLQQLGSTLSSPPNYQSSQITSPNIEPINTNQSNVTPLYSADNCIGSSVNGMCYGTVLPNAQPTSYCRGIVVNGQCSGAVTDY